MLKMPFGISKDGVTASQRIAKTLSQVSLTFNSEKTINPLIDGMDYLASNTKMRDDIKVDATPHASSFYLSRSSPFPLKKFI